MNIPGSCAICQHVTRCTTECGGGGWADSCERQERD